MLATCHSAGGRQLRNHDFDVVIIDEATQALEAVGQTHFDQIQCNLKVAGVLDTDFQSQETDPGRRPDATAADHPLDQWRQEI